MMDNEVRLDQPLPDDVVAEMRTLYAGPSDLAYWASLETRVMAEITANSQRTASRHHWSWVQTGLAAAVAILIAMGTLLVRSHAAEIRAVYDSMMKPTTAESLASPKGALGEREGSDTRDATLRDVIKH
jgi:hypothetical protein